MAYETVVGLDVEDGEVYAQYREEMRPLLQAAGGEFRYDFEVGRTLKNSSDHEINRVFVLAFPDGNARQRFFADPAYREIRGRLFDRAVRGTTIIAEYTR